MTTTKMTTEEVLESIQNSLHTACDPKTLLNDTANLIDEYNGSNKKGKEELQDKIDEKMGAVMAMMNIDKNYTVSEAVSERLRPLTIEFCKHIVKEYDCKTTSEKALAQLASSAYVRILEYTRIFNGSIRDKYLSHEQNGYYSLFSKEVDRAYRQFNTSITTLKQLRSPQIEVNIRAKTAFVADQQQINDNRNATIESKESK